MFRAARDSLLRLIGERAGNVAMVTALALPVMLGAFGIGAEAASWMTTKRALQNAADAAAIAAATNAGANYADEAKAVAARYGFVDGSGGVKVTADDTVACPAGAGDGPCYAVTLTKTTPVLLAQVVGYRGDAVVDGSPSKIVSAKAVAVQGETKRPYCLLALGTSGVGSAIQTNGAPKAELSGCNVMSNTAATCNGHDLNADVGDAHKVNNGCGQIEHSNVATASDPYAKLADNIPKNDGCNGKYQAAPAKKKDPFTPLTITGPVTTSCGYAGLSQDITITQDTTLYVANGDLDLNGHTLSTANGAHLTIVFTGTNSASYSHSITGGGTLDFQAPTSGDWQGIAMYQDPALTQGVNIASAGNSPTWNVTGVAYFPHSSVTFSGAVNKSSDGASCFAMVVDNVTINGTGSILAHGECAKAGVILPTSDVAGRGKLVQ